MRKLAIAVCLIGLLIGSTLGGIALADKGGTPNPGNSTPDLANSPLGTIIDEVTDPVSGLEAIKAEIDDPAHGLIEIKKEVAAIEGNITDPVFGLAALEMEIADIRAQLDDPATGLAEIKAEVAAIEEDVAAIKTDIEGIKSDTEEILDRLTTFIYMDCTEAKRLSCADGLYQVSGTVTVYGLTPVQNVNVRILAEYVESATLHWDTMQPFTTYNFTKTFTAECYCSPYSSTTTSVGIDLYLTGTAWGHNPVTSYDYRQIPSGPC